MLAKQGLVVGIREPIKSALMVWKFIFMKQARPLSSLLFSCGYRSVIHFGGQ